LIAGLALFSHLFKNIKFYFHGRWIPPYIKGPGQKVASGKAAAQTLHKFHIFHQVVASGFSYRGEMFKM
jgi:hypothetical protein